jgi:hypothetical protein
VLELSTITIIEEGDEGVKSSPPPPPPTMATTMANMQAEMIIVLGEAQRLSDAMVHEWFATRRAPVGETLVEEVDKRLVMLLARKTLAESLPTMDKGCIADAVAHAIALTLFM